MDRRFLDYYESELRFLRDLGGEFAQAHPGVAGRLAGYWLCRNVASNHRYRWRISQ